MSDECLESRQKSSDAINEEMSTDRESGHGKLPTSLLKQAMASARIQKTFHEFKARAELPFEENAPSIELMLERELIDAYDDILEEIAAESREGEDPLLHDVMAIEAACQDFIEEALADHLEVRLEELGTENSGPAEEHETDTLVSRLKAPRDSDYPYPRHYPKPGENLLSGSPQEGNGNAGAPVVNDPDPNGGQRPFRYGRVLLIAGMIAAPAIAGAAFVKIQSPDKFDNLVSVAKDQAYHIAALAEGGSPDQPRADALAQANAQNDIPVVAKPIPGLVDDGVGNGVQAGTQSATQSRIAVATARVSAVGERNQSLATMVSSTPIVNAQPAVDTPPVALDEMAVIQAGLKSLEAETERLTKLLANPNQQKAAELEALISEKRVKISQLQERLRAIEVAGAPSAPAQTVREVVVPKNPEIQIASIDAAQSDVTPVSTTAVETQAVNTANGLPGDPGDYLQKFPGLISVNQLPVNQQQELATLLARGECIAPAAMSVLNKVPTLVMRDLVQTFPDHC
jgi:hypothetical protein